MKAERPAFQTLPDLVSPGLRVLSVGLNPSLPSVAAGFYFANPRNRFWKALNKSDLLSTSVEPGPVAMRWLLVHEGFGFTDLVKRPTRGGAELYAADYREGAPRLRRLIEYYQPAFVWFHGKMTYRGFTRYSGLAGDHVEWGLQLTQLGCSRLFVTPNPSPANASFSLNQLVTWYNRLNGILPVPRGTDRLE